MAEWSAAILASARCAVCGVGVRMKLNGDGTPATIRRGPRAGLPVMINLNAHHLLDRDKHREHRTDRRNGICLCPRHHKFGRYSFHRSPIWAAEWLRRNRPEQYAWAVAVIEADPLSGFGAGPGEVPGAMILVEQWR
jgi:hypothetical protein